MVSYQRQNRLPYAKTEASPFDVHQEKSFVDKNLTVACSNKCSLEINEKSFWAGVKNELFL